MAAEEPREGMDPGMGPARRRRAMRVGRSNTEALVIAAIPIVVLLVIVLMGAWLFRSHKDAGTPPAVAIPTHLPTLGPATLVSAKKATATEEPASPPSPTLAPDEPTATPEPVLEPTPDEPTAAPAEATLEPTAVPDDVLAPGANATVSNTSGRGLRMRSGPGVDQPTLKVVAEGAVVNVIAGPTEADGYQWFQVRDDTGTEGWVAADWLVRVN